MKPKRRFLMRAFSAESAAATSRPSRRILPDVGESTRPSRWRSVDFPTPLLPVTARTSPRSTWRDAPSSTTMSVWAS